MQLPARNSTALPTPEKAAPLTAPALADVSHESADPRRYIAVVLSRWWIVLLLTLLGAAAGTAFAAFATPRYRSTCRYEMLIDERLRISSTNTQAPISVDGVLRLRARQMMLLTSAPLQKAVAEKLAPRWKGDLSSLDASVVPKTVRDLETMLDISVDSASADYALAYLKELVDQYETAQRDQSLENNENSMRSLWVEKKHLADELEAAQHTLMLFQKEHNILFSQVKQQFDDAFLANLIQRQNALKMERTMLESQFPAIRKANAPTIEDVLNLTMSTNNLTGMTSAPIRAPGADPALAIIANLGKNQPDRMAQPAAGSWQEQEELVSRLDAEYKDMLKTYRATHPKMIELRRQIDIANRELRFGAETALKRLQARYEALKIQETALEDAAKDWRGEINMSVADRATYENMQAKVEHLKKLHDQVYARIIDGAAQTVDTTFNHPVEAPHSIGMIFPNKPLIMIISIIVGLLAGIAMAFLLDLLDTSMTDVLAIEQKLGIPFLSSIPTWDRTIPNLDMKNPTVIVERGKQSIPSEAYRSLRTSLESIVGTRKGYALAITSTDANEGKSLTIVNLAAVFSWTGRKVLVVDCDLRRGRLQESFSMEKKMGLTDFLTNKVADWHNIVTPTGIENLDLIQVGAYHASAPELLDPPRIRRLIEEWGKEYDLILFDSAPIGRVVDSALLGRACDGLLLVARHGHCSFAGVSHALHRLEGTKIIGFCLNGIDSAGRRTGYAAGYYGYFRKYGAYGGYYSYDRYGYGQYGYGATTVEAKTDTEDAPATANKETTEPKAEV